MVGEVWVPFEAVVATSHRVDKYGGVRLAPEALQQIADAMNSGSVPMLGHHDWTRPIRTKDVEAEVVGMDDGEQAVRIAGLVDQDDLLAAGSPPGFSYTAYKALGRVEGPNPHEPPITLSADAGWFSDESIAHASELMCALAPVDGQRLYQFSAVEDLRVVADLAYSLVKVLGPGLATSAIWDGFKYLLEQARQRASGTTAPTTRFAVWTTTPWGEVGAMVDTSDPEVVSQALASYADAVQALERSGAAGRQVISWDAKGGGGWLPPA